MLQILPSIQSKMTANDEILKETKITSAVSQIRHR